MAHWAEERASEDYYQVLRPDGTTNHEPPDLGEEELVRFYRTFIKTRAYEGKMEQLQRGGEVNLATLSRGEEATPLGSAAALDPGDWVFPSYRQRPAFFYWGSDVARSIAGRMGASSEAMDEYLDDTEEPEINFTPVYVPLATNVMNAAGFSMVDGFEDTDVVTLAYIGDGSTSQGDFYEGLNFAGVFDAPLVTIIQNNQWAISVPSDRQTAAETFAQKGEAVGIPYERVDGNDVFAVYEKTREAVEAARNDGGPAIVECVTYRRSAHNTADEPDTYRTEDEAEYWEERDPVDRYEAYLKNEGVLTEAEMEEIREEIQQEVDDAVKQARKIPSNSDPMSLFENHLHGEGWHEHHQKQELRAELEGRNPFTDFDGGGLE